MSPAWLLGEKEVVVLPFDPVVAEVGETEAVYPAVGLVVTEKVNGTPGCPEPSLAVMVIGAPPAVNDVEDWVTDTAVAPFKSYATHVGPGYEPGVEPPSMRVVEKVSWGGAAVAGEAVLMVMGPSGRVSEKPAARPVPIAGIVNVIAEDVDTEIVVRYMHWTFAMVHTPVASGVLNVAPLGAKTVSDVIAYVLVIGLVIFSVLTAVATPVM